MTKTEVKTLQIVLNEAGITYPIKTLHRRMELLTPIERLVVEDKIEELVAKAEEIEEIIAKRAQVENDRWP